MVYRATDTKLRRDVAIKVLPHAFTEDKERLARFEPGAGGDYKFLRGFDAQPTYSLHYLADPRLRAAVERFLAAERTEAGEVIEHLNRQSALKTSS